jgi:hypothetical protein
MYISDLSPVDLGPAYRVFTRAQQYLKNRGLDILPRDMQRLLLLAKSLAVWYAADQGVETVKCTEELAVFCLMEECVAGADLGGLVLGAEIDGYVLVGKSKKLEALVQALAGRTMRRDGQPIPVMKDQPPRVLVAFVKQEPRAVLVEAIQWIAPVGSVMGMTRRRTGEPHIWRRVE